MSSYSLSYHLAVFAFIWALLLLDHSHGMALNGESNFDPSVNSISQGSLLRSKSWSYPSYSKSGYGSLGLLPPRTDNKHGDSNTDWWWNRQNNDNNHGRQIVLEEGTVQQLISKEALIKLGEFLSFALVNLAFPGGEGSVLER